MHKKAPFLSRFWDVEVQIWWGVPSFEDLQMQKVRSKWYFFFSKGMKRHHQPTFSTRFWDVRDVKDVKILIE